MKNNTKILKALFICTAIFLFGTTESADVFVNQAANKAIKDVLYENTEDSLVTTNVVQSESFLFKYYRNLQYNIVENLAGICGYTGIGMLLSYYDTYYSDEFIPEHFESLVTKIESSDFDSSTIFYQSPGLKNTASTMKSPQQLIENEIRDIQLQYNNLPGVFTTERLLDAFLMKQVVNQIDNPNSFLGKLFEIAIDNDIILFSKSLDTYRNLEPISIVMSSNISNNYLTGYGVSYNIINTLLNKYLDTLSFRENITVITDKISADTQTERNRIRSQIINHLRNGSPVLCGGNMLNEDNSYSGHEVVAYHYDEINDIIYGHAGWIAAGDTALANGTYMLTDLDQLFDVGFSDYWKLSINYPTKKDFTNNYYFTDLNMYYSPGLERTFIPFHPYMQNLPNSYTSNVTYANVDLLTDLSNDIVETERLRVKIDLDANGSLSAGGLGVGTAYISYKFTARSIRGIILDASFFFQNEYTTSENSDFFVQAKVNNSWLNVFDFWQSNLPNSTTNFKRLEISFEESVEEFRIYSTSQFVAIGDYSRLFINKLFLF